MNSDLKPQLRDFADELIRDLPKIEVDDIVAREAVVRPRKRRSGLLVAVTAAAAVVIVLGAIALLRQPQEQVSDDVTPVQTTPTSVDAEPDEPVTESPTQVEWTAVSMTGFADGAILNDVMHGAGKYVAVGSVGTEPDLDAAVWVSEDGVRWMAASGDLGGDGPQSISAVVFGNDRFVAVGEDWLAPAPPGDAAPDAPDLAVWVSQDGLNWTRVADEDGALGGPGGQSLWNAYDVAYGDAGYVFLGSERLPKPLLVSWASLDGITWVRETLCSESSCIQPGLSGLGDAGFDEVTIQALTFGNGTYVAVGVPRPPQAPLVLHSSDGLQWSLPAGLQGLSGAAIADLTYSNGQFIATGSIVAGESGAGNGAVWTSPDAVTWDLVIEDQSQPRFEIVTSGGGRALAIPSGVRNTAAAPVWSYDGQTWTRTTFDTAVGSDAGDLFFSAAATADGGHVVVGSLNITPDGATDTWSTLVWRGQAQ